MDPDEEYKRHVENLAPPTIDVTPSIMERFAGAFLDRGRGDIAEHLEEGLALGQDLPNLAMLGYLHPDDIALIADVAWGIYTLDDVAAANPRQWPYDDVSELERWIAAAVETRQRVRGELPPEAEARRLVMPEEATAVPATAVLAVLPQRIRMVAEAVVTLTLPDGWTATYATDYEDPAIMLHHAAEQVSVVITTTPQCRWQIHRDVIGWVDRAAGIYATAQLAVNALASAEEPR